jgi:hypothetical protein
MGKTGVKSSPMCLVLCYGTITKGKLTVGKVGYITILLYVYCYLCR